MARITDARVVIAIPFRVRVGEREFVVTFQSEDTAPPNNTDVIEIAQELIVRHTPEPTPEVAAPVGVEYAPVSTPEYRDILDSLEAHPSREYWSESNRDALANRMALALADGVPGDIEVELQEWKGLTNDARTGPTWTPQQFAADIGSITKVDGS